VALALPVSDARFPGLPRIAKSHLAVTVPPHWLGRANLVRGRPLCAPRTLVNNLPQITKWITEPRRRARDPDRCDALAPGQI
jgi:hypothetical protein